MSLDLFLGETDTSWSRGKSNPTTSGYNGHWKFIRGDVSDSESFSFTESEKSMLARLAATKSRADAGDQGAKKKLALLTIHVASLRAKAKQGDAEAKRALLVLRESGIFNPMQKLDVSGSLFKDEPHAKEHRAERWEDEVNKVSAPDQIENLAKLIAFNPEYTEHTKKLVAQGNTTARKILDASAKYAAGTTSSTPLPKLVRGKVVESSGYSNDTLERLRAALAQLKKKDPKTDDDRRSIEAITERLTRLEAMSGVCGAQSFVGRRHHRPTQAERQQRLASLKTRAAAGDQAAVAKLQKIQSKLTAELSTLNSPQAATTPTTAPPVIPGTTPTVPGAPPAIPPYGTTNYPATYPPGYPTSYPQNYPAYQPQYAYQSPYYDPSTMDPYGPAPQPTVDVYQGDVLGEEEAALARAAGGPERAALARSGRMGRSQVRGSFVGGLAIPNPVYRATIQKYARRRAGGASPSTKDVFLAKAAVDKAMGRAGVGLYMPGAQPGRRTI